MSRVKLYVDEDAVERIVVDGLTAAGFDVLTTLEAGGKGASDDAQLHFAVEQGRAIYSLNVADFVRLHGEVISSGKEHAGILVIPKQRYGASEKLRRILAVINQRTAEELRNQLIYL